MKLYIIEVEAEPEAFRELINSIVDQTQKGATVLRSYRAEEVGADMKLTREDHQNINKWITATGIMIEGGIRTAWTPSEEATLAKLDQMKKEGGLI